MENTMHEKEHTQDQCCQNLKSNHEGSETETSRCSSLEAQLQTCQKELNEWRDKAMRSYADFENFKRRSEKERMQWMLTAQKEILTSILSIVDDVERALVELQKKEHTPEMDVWFSGFSMIAQSLQKMLKQWHVNEITAIEQFNPELHEAIISVEAEGKQHGDIVAVLQKGYLFNDDVLRPAKVSVAK